MMKNKKFWISLAVLAAVVFLSLKWMGGKEKETSYQAVQARKGYLQATILATGIVLPQNRLEIKPPIAGRAEEILVREGERIEKGQVLAWMSSVERAALLDAARAKGPEELAHWEELYKAAPLIAPLDGVIISRSVEPGQTVTAQDAVLVMSNRLIVKAQVDETDIGQVRIGQKAVIALDAYPKKVIAARTDHIAYEAKTVSNVTIYEVDVVPQRVPDFMRSGMTANVTFVVRSKEDALFLPAEALHQENGRTMALVPNPANPKEPLSVEVKTGISDGKKTEILSGIEEGDSVLVKVLGMPKSSQAQGSPFSPWTRRRSSSSGGSGGRR